MNFNLTINKVFDYLFCLMIIFLPLSFAYPNIIIILLILIFFFDFKNTKKIDFSPLKKPPVIIIWSLIFYWYVKDIVSGHLLDNKHSLFLLIFIVPVLFLKIQNQIRIYVAFVVLGFVVALNASVGLLDYYFVNHQLLPFEGTVINQILKMERPYLGFICLIAIISSLNLSFYFRKYAWPMYAYALLMGTFIFIISARISSISLVVILLFYLFFYLKTSFKNKLIFSSVALITIISFVAVNKSFRERLYLNGDTTEAVSKLKSYEPRLVIWSCAKEIIQNPDFNHWFGISSEKKIEDLLVLGYDKKLTNKYRAQYYMDVKLNTHNQFIGTYLNSGIIGLLLLVGYLVFQFVSSRKNFTKTAMIVSLVLFLLVENVLYRQIGVYLFAIIIVITTVNFDITKKDIVSEH